MIFSKVANYESNECIFMVVLVGFLDMHQRCRVPSSGKGFLKYEVIAIRNDSW